jgi:hypothetical protein
MALQNISQIEILWLAAQMLDEIGAPIDSGFIASLGEKIPDSEQKFLMAILPLLATRLDSTVRELRQLRNILKDPTQSFSE